MRVERKSLAEKFRKSGQTQDVFCKEHEINIHKLRYYLYKKDNHRLSSKPSKKGFAPNRVSAPFISFSGNTPCDGTQKRYPVTIINGHFTSHELLEFISASTGRTSC
jgi:hypothetical protein